MSEDLFNEFAALWPIAPSDVEGWAEHDRRLAARAAEQNSTAERDRMRRRAVTLREGGFPDEALHGALLSKPKDTVALKHARLFAQLPMKSFVLAGGVGVGKTTAATWLALKREDSQPGFLRASDLERGGRYDKKRTDWLKERTSLVLDDLGVEVLDGKGVFLSLLDETIDQLYGRRAILVVTTNLDEAQIAARYGARAWSRFEQRGQWASCGMRDLRKEQP